MLSQIKHLYKLRGGNKYMIDEPITQISHAIQTSLAIKEMGGDREMQTAGLLHDIGHLLSIPVEPDSGTDDKHEFLGGIWLKRNNFPERVYILFLGNYFVLAIFLPKTHVYRLFRNPVQLE